MRFGFHYNKPESQKTKVPTLSLHVHGRCHLVHSLDVKVPVKSRVRNQSPRIVMFREATRVSIGAKKGGGTMSSTVHRSTTSWLLTQSGRQFYPLAPKSEDISIEDVAHALSHICRYGGHCNPFYSVAQHCVHVSYLVPEAKAKLGLLHDGPEAYVGDVVRPLKYAMPQYLEIEGAVWRAFATRFGLPPEQPTDDPEIKYADDVALMTERRDVMPKSPHSWGTKAMPDTERIYPWAAEAARNLFLSRYKELFE